MVSNNFSFQHLSFQQWSLSVFALAAIYFIAGKLGLMLAIPPGYATAVWPASGLALTAVLVGGRQLWPGVFLGSLIINVELGIVAGNGILDSALVAAVIGAGASLQAIISAAVIRHVKAWPSALDNTRDIALLLLIGGPLGCVIAASVGTITLVLSGAVAFADWLNTWGVWWVGDTVGVLLITPVAILLLAPSKLGISLIRKAVVAAILGAIFICAIFVYVKVIQWERERTQDQLLHAAEDILHDLDLSMLNYTDALFAVERFFNGSENVTEEKFHNFVEPDVGRFKGLLAIEWAPVVKHAERAVYEEQYGWPIVVQGQSKAIITAPPQHNYAPVTYIEPPVGSGFVRGYDLKSSAILARAMRAADQSGNPIATAKVKLTHLADSTDVGMFLVQPIYDPTPSGGWNLVVEGYAVGVINLQVALNAALAKVDKDSIRMLITDVTDGARSFIWGDPELYMDKFAHERGRKFLIYEDYQLDIAGRNWEVIIARSSNYVSATHTWAVWFVLLSGMLISSTVGALLLLVTGRADSIQRQVEEKTAALSASEDTLRQALENAPIGNALVRPDGSFIKLNKALTNMLGYSERELNELDFYAIVHPEDLGIGSAEVEELLAGDRETVHVDKRFLHKHGHTIWAKVSISLVRDSAGTPDYFITQIEDISERRQIERLKSDFVATVSHELRTPVTSIRGALSLVCGGAAGKLPDKAAEMLNIAHKNSERLVHIINDILDVEKIEAGQLQLQLGVHNVAEVLQSAVEANQAYAERHQVTFELAKVPAALTILADGSRVMQIMANLLSNAAKFSPAGTSVFVNVTATEDEVVISVVDQGYGIPAEFQKLVFEKFAQAEDSTTRRFDGTGLGLNITRRLVEAMGGSIHFTSEEGRGTTFTFTLPRPADNAEGVVPAGSDNANGRLLLVGPTRRLEDRKLKSDLVECGYALVSVPDEKIAAKELSASWYSGIIVNTNHLAPADALKMAEKVQKHNVNCLPLVLVGSAGVIVSAQNVLPEAIGMEAPFNVNELISLLLLGS